VTFPELAKQGFIEGGNLVVELRIGAPKELPEPIGVVFEACWTARIPIR